MSLMAIALKLPDGSDLDETCYLPEVPFPGDTVEWGGMKLLVIRRGYRPRVKQDVTIVNSTSKTGIADLVPEVPIAYIEVRINK